jgi:O-antigen/teichoic acid export membrane protein
MNTGKFTVAQNSATTLATQVASYALNFAAGIIIARSLGPANKGTLSLVVLSHVLLLTVSNLGLAAASSFLIARRGFSLDQVGRHAVAAAMCLGFATLALTAVVVNFLPTSVVSPSQRVYVLLAAGLVPLALATQFLNGALVGAGQIIWLNGLTLAQAFINVAGLVLFLLVLRLGLAGGLTAWTVTVVSTCVLTVAVTFWRARRLSHHSANRSTRWNRALADEGIRYGIRAYPAGVVSFLNLRSDQFLLGYLAGTASVGIYSVAVTVAELLLFFPRSLATALMPRITGADSVSAKHMAASACRHTVGGALISVAVLVPIGLLIPVLFGEAYRPSVVPFFLLLPGLAAYALAPVLSTYFSGQLGRPIVTSLFAGMSLALDVLLVWALVPRLGVAGAALASTLAYLATIVVMVTYFRRLTGVSLRAMFAVSRGDFAAYRSVFDPLLRLRSIRSLHR